MQSSSKSLARRGPPTVLSAKEEKDIIHWANERMVSTHVRHTDILDHVQKYLIKEGRQNPFTNNRPGRSWIKSFLKRHPKFYETLQDSRKAYRSGDGVFVPDDESDCESNGDDQSDTEASWVIDTNDSNSNLDSDNDLKMDCSNSDSRVTASSDTNKDLEMFVDSDDDDEFLGFTDEKPYFATDMETLNYENLDAVEITGLPDAWWSKEEISTPIPNKETTPAVAPSTSITPIPSPSGTRLRSASSNPAFRKPFDYGFKREIVYRGVVDGGNNARRLADVYYISPDGRKMRSIRDVSDYLDERIDDIKLSLSNFTFLKEPIGMNDSTKEIVRDAKRGTFSPKLKKPSTPVKPLAKLVKPKSQAMPVQAVVPRTVSTSTVVPRAVSTGTVAPRAVSVNKPLNVVKLLPVTQSKPPVVSQSPPQDNNMPNTSRSLMPPCSIHCEHATGLIPSLQCCICVCLYHPVCVGLPVSSENLTSYICPNCKQEKDQNSNMAQQDLLSPRVGDHPRSQGIPQPVLPPLSMLHSVATMENPSLSQGEKAMYSLGNWRPPLMPMQGSPATQPWPEHIPQQSLAMMNGKKYVVIPRNNIAAVGNSPEEEMNKTVASPMAVPPQMQLAASQFSSNAMLPKGAFFVNQAGSPGTMFLLKPAENQEGYSQTLPQFLLMNPTGTIPTNKIATTPSNLCMVPKLPEEMAATQAKEVPQRSQPFTMKGGYSFTERLTAHHEALLSVMRYLTVQELLRAACVSRAWRLVASDPSLWVSARLKNSQVKDWDGCMAALLRHGTTHLDLRKTLMPKREEEAQAAWQQFCTALRESPAGQLLQRIDLCRCPPHVVATVAECCPQLCLLSAPAITTKADLDLQSISKLQKLQGLRLKTFHGMTLENFEMLRNSRNLTQLSLTSIRMLSAVDVASALAANPNLEVLELGDCPGLLTHPSLVANALRELHKLKRLRLEKLVTDPTSEQGAVNTLLQALHNTSSLVHLELVNIEAGPGCDEALGAIVSLQQLLLVPSYLTHGGITCQLLLRGVLKLDQLQDLTWVVTNEVIGCTKKLIKTHQSYGQSDESQECIPVLPPVPGDTDEEGSPHGSKQKTNFKTDKLVMLPLARLKTILHTGLPKTKVAFNRITFQGTWRQTLSDWDLAAS